MGLSFVGHSPSFEIWVFNIDGKQFVGRNFSTPSPLQLRFRGVMDKYSGSSPLINTSGFNITESTDKVIVWTWGGKLYTSWWQALSDDIEDPDAAVNLEFGPAVPYSGPPVAPVGTGVTSPTPQTPASDAVDETKAALDAANRALAVSESKRTLDTVALNTARIELEAAKSALAAAQSKATADQAVLMSQLQERLDDIQGRTNVQIGVYQQAMQQAKAEAQAANAAAAEARDAMEAVSRSLAISEQQKMVNVQALNNARIELETAKAALAAAEAKATKDQAVMIEQLREQMDAIQGRTDVQISVYKQALQKAQAEAQAANASAMETKQALDAVSRSLAISENEKKVNMEALNNARIELETAKAAFAAAEAKATREQAAMIEQLREQLDVVQQRTQIQIDVVKQSMQQAAPTTPVVITSTTTSPVVTTPTTPAVSPAGTDWVKLGLQLGAAYLLLS